MTLASTHEKLFGLLHVGSEKRPGPQQSMTTPDRRLQPPPTQTRVAGPVVPSAPLSYVAWPLHVAHW